MIKVFSRNDSDFTTNGDKILKPITAKVHKEDNGDYYLELEAGIEYVDYIVQGNIIVVPTPTGEQAFRIYNLEKTRLKIKCKAYHLFYDTENYLIEDSYIVDKNCNDALDHLNRATDNVSPFIMLSDVSTINSYRCVRTSLYGAIQTVLERWGGHLVRDNFKIEIRNKIGQDNGVTIRYKKNLKEINCQEDWSNVVTKLMPVGKDGLILNEKYVYSDITYDTPYTKCISFNQEIDEEEYKDESGTLNEEDYKQALLNDLRNQAKEYIEQNKYPKINYKLKANLEKITDVGDVVEVIDERLNISLLTNVISFDYDCILNKYTEIEFGNFRKKLSNYSEYINKITDEKIEEGNSIVSVKLQKELTDATDKIWGTLGNSYVIYEGDKILIVDTIPKENAKNIMVINSAGIGFSQNGISGTFNSAWQIDGTLDMQSINVINLVADMIKGGTLKLGSNLNEYGKIELYDEANKLIGEFNKNGLKMYGQDDSYVLLNNEVGFAGYDRNDNKIYWVDKDEFHQKKSVIEEEITLCNKMRFIPITIYDSNNNIVNDGIGLVSVY